MPPHPTVKEELAAFISFMNKTKRSIMLNHNQSLEKIKQRSVTSYESLTAEINSKLVN